VVEEACKGGTTADEVTGAVEEVVVVAAGEEADEDVASDVFSPQHSKERNTHAQIWDCFTSDVRRHLVQLAADSRTFGAFQRHALKTCVKHMLFHLHVRPRPKFKRGRLERR